MNKNSRILIPGSTGMVGSSIFKELWDQGYESVFSVPKEFDLRKQTDCIALFDIVKPEYVFLAAAKVGGIQANIDYPVNFMYDNLMIATNIIDCCHMFKVKKLINISSSCIYPTYSPSPLREEYLFTGKFEPTNEYYAFAKAAAIKLCEAYHKQYNCNFITLIPPNLYGKHPKQWDLKNSHFIPALIRKFYEAKKNNTNVSLWGDGTPVREIMAVEELAKACVYAMENWDYKDVEGIINIGNNLDAPLSIKEYANLIKTVIGYQGKVIWDKTKPNGMQIKYMDLTKMNSLSWECSKHNTEYLIDLYNWYKENNDK